MTEKCMGRGIMKPLPAQLKLHSYCTMLFITFIMTLDKNNDF